MLLLNMLSPLSDVIWGPRDPRDSCGSRVSSSEESASLTSIKQSNGHPTYEAEMIWTHPDQGIQRMRLSAVDHLRFGRRQEAFQRHSYHSTA